MASNTQNCHVPENKKKSCGWIWLSEEFKVNIGLRQGNDPLLFIMVVALISRKFSKKDVLRKEMYANDLAMIADKKQELQEVLQEWKGVFKKEGPIMSREKTEEMWV